MPYQVQDHGRQGAACTASSRFLHGSCERLRDPDTMFVGKVLEVRGIRVRVRHLCGQFQRRARQLLSYRVAYAHLVKYRLWFFQLRVS